MIKLSIKLKVKFNLYFIKKKFFVVCFYFDSWCIYLTKKVLFSKYKIGLNLNLSLRDNSIYFLNKNKIVWTVPMET